MPTLSLPAVMQTPAVQLIALVLSYGIVAACATYATMLYVRSRLSHYARDIRELHDSMQGMRNSMNAMLTLVVAMAQRDGVALPAELFQVPVSPRTVAMAGD